MVFLSEEAWERANEPIDMCDDHDHCEMCGVCAEDNELLLEHLVGEESMHECIRCRAKALREDCK